MITMKDILNVNYNSVKVVIGDVDYNEDLSRSEAVLMAFINYKNDAPSNAVDTANYNIKDFKLENREGGEMSSKDLGDSDYIIFPSYAYTNDADGNERKVETRYLVSKVEPVDTNNVIDPEKDVLALFKITVFNEGSKDSGYVSEDGIIVGTAVREYLPMRELGEDVDDRHKSILKLLYELDTNSPFHNKANFTAVYKSDDLLSVMVKSMFMICGYHDLSYVDFDTMPGAVSVDGKPDLSSIDMFDTELITIGLSHVSDVSTGIAIEADIIDIVSNMRKELDPEYVDVPERITRYVDFIKRYATDNKFRILDTTAICFERQLSLHGAELFVNRFLTSIINGNHDIEEGSNYIEEATKKVVTPDVYLWALEETRSREEVLHTDNDLTVIEIGDGVFACVSLTSEGFNAIAGLRVNDMLNNIILLNITHNGNNVLFQGAARSKFLDSRDEKDNIMKITSMYSGYDVEVNWKTIDSVTMFEFELPVKNLGEFWFKTLANLNEYVK